MAVLAEGALQPDWTGYWQKNGKGATYRFRMWRRQPDWTGYPQKTGKGVTYPVQNVAQTT